MIKRKLVVDNIIQRVEQTYLDKLIAEGVMFEKSVVQVQNAALEFTIIVVGGVGDAGARFFADHFVTAQFTGQPSIFRSGCSYRVISASSYHVGFNDDYNASSNDVSFDLTSPGIVQLSEAPAEEALDYERLLKDLLAGVSNGQSSQKLILRHVLERALNAIRCAAIVSTSNRGIIGYLDQAVRLLERHDYLGVVIEDTLEKQASNAG